MDFKKVLASWGYNIGNSVPVETLVDEILPDMFGKKVYTESEVVELLKQREENIQDSIKYDGVEYLTIKEWFEQFKKK